MRIKKNKFVAFTLAEVLLTLGIIGIVAEMTIPTLVNNINNSQYVSGLKKGMSEFSSAINLIMSDNGGTLVNLFANNNDLLDTVCTKLVCSKKCHSSDTQDCFHNGYVSKINGTNINFPVDFSSIGGVSGILSDGSSFFISNFDSTCNSNGIQLCFVISIDVNGVKTPNKMGRDVFEYYVEQQGVKLAGHEYPHATDYCDPTLSSITYNGMSCGLRVFQEGGMNY